LAVLQRVSTPSRSQIPPSQHTDAPDEDVSMHCGDEGSGDELGAKGAMASAVTETSYTIHTIVRKKIVFSKRPTPIVGSSAKIGAPLPAPL
jgi:hypothetical protein